MVTSINRDAAEEVLGSYRATLDKINDGRGKTDNSIAQIKGLMVQAEQDSHKSENLIRQKVLHVKYLLE